MERSEMDEGPHVEVVLETGRGPVTGRHYRAEGAVGVVWVGGIGGGWDTPGRQLYPRLAARFANAGVQSLRVRFRLPGHLEECVADVLAGLAFLRARGVRTFGLVGHSFGGAVVIGVAAQVPLVRTVVAIATMSSGADSAASLGPRCSLLLLHGTIDPVLPPSHSQRVAALAQEPKRLVLFEGANHELTEVAGQLEDLVEIWLRQELLSG